MNENNFKVKVNQSNKTVEQTATSFNQFRFIKAIYECELQQHILIQRRRDISKRREKICSEINNYQNTDFYKKYMQNIKREKKITPEPCREKYDVKEYLDGYIVVNLIIGGILDIIITIISFVIKAENRDIFVLPGLVLAIIITVAVPIYKQSKLNEEYSKKVDYRNSIISENQRIKNNNKKALEEYNKAREEWQSKKEIEIEEKLDVLKNEIDELDIADEQSYDTLKSLYNLKINDVLCLHPNYRGLVPISVIYGYFETGRCSQLQGHEGAYNLYEDEKLKGIIINKLDVISNQLNKLNGTMIYVGQALEECNRTLSALEEESCDMMKAIGHVNQNISYQLNEATNSARKIEANTANSAYYAEVSAKMNVFNTAYNLLNS